MNLQSFKVKVTLILIFSMVFSLAVSNMLIYRFALESQLSQLRDKLMIIAQTASLVVDPKALLEIPLNPEGKNTPQYKAIENKLVKIRQGNPSITYIYVMSMTGQEGIWQFIVDAEVPATVNQRTADPGEKYDASRFSEILKGFQGPSADRELEVDEWGATLSGYAPVYDESGRPIALLGVDIMADDVFKTQREVNVRVFSILFGGILLSIFIGILFSRKITDPIKKLVEATGHIAEGNFNFRVQIKSQDEIGQLGNAFNQMSESLHEAKEELHGYFYKIVQSLIRGIEAKDRYTRGHSERVAEYAAKIAAGLGFPEEKIELLREAASLHDIGKLGVKEDILNKKDKLNEEEWDIIRRHPAVGEDILKPVMSDKEMLTVIREHHEHCDGSGYPDRLSADKITLFAKIVAVADAYDAMTSSRAYRPALSREKAIEELRKGAGTQFDEKIVDVFIGILAQEG
ncbi:MAG: HD domain-containing protein [Candidatus Omnitrophica bacterium]|nr:HD domain-containing protein [Candidatus Omnitrophota bacterium]